ncbi:MAG: hypothetical protein ABIQ11_09795, partial [Saprospiraceae bacterium]
DDPPEMVRAKSPHGGENPDPIKFATTTPSEPITANHNVVSGKDITIIIDMVAILDMQANNPGEKDYYLVFDSLESISTATAAPPAANYFTVQPSFHNHLHHSESGYPTNTYSYDASTPQRVKLLYDPAKRYTYINLRPTSAINRYGPDASGARYRALFRIVDKSNAVVTQRTEDITLSFDPNLIRVDSVTCHDNQQMVYYYLQFQNTSETQAANDVAVKVKFPAIFEEDKFEILEWSLRGSPFPGALSILGGEYTFSFKSGTINSSLEVCASPFDTRTCTGYIKFKIGVSATTDLTNISNSLQLENPITIFDGVSYPIEIFEDWMVLADKRSKGWIRPITGNCGGEGDPSCWWLWLLIGILILVLLFFILRKRRTNQSSPLTT